MKNSIAKYLNSKSPQQLEAVLETCCASGSWVKAMVAGGEFASDQELMARAERDWDSLVEADYLEAFLAHPRIGDVDSLRQKYANTKAIASGEQSGVDAADEATLTRLAAANDEYFYKFGFIFIVCATGNTAKQMLEILESRLPNQRDVEVANAAAEQMKITKLRLEKLVQ